MKTYEAPAILFHQEVVFENRWGSGSGSGSGGSESSKPPKPPKPPKRPHG